MYVLLQLPMFATDVNIILIESQLAGLPNKSITKACLSENLKDWSLYYSIDVKFDNPINNSKKQVALGLSSIYWQ